MIFCFDEPGAGQLDCTKALAERSLDFSYGVRRAMGERNEKDIRKRIQQERKAEKASRKAAKRGTAL